MENLQIIFILLFVAVLLVGVAQKIRVPYPITLVLGGTVIGFIPGLHDISFDPNVILFIVLPPILYYAAFGIAFREFQRNWRTIFSLALGLVVFTTIVVAFIFKWMFPEFSWALAFAFGAIVSPPDAIAATTIFKRFAISSRLVAMLEGESLINDASAIVLYKLAVFALLSGTFSFAEGSHEFLQGVFGGVLIGFILGFSFQTFSRRFLGPVLGAVFSFTIPYITFIVANFLEVSGVLAVVVNGLIGSRILLAHHSSLRRILGYATWDIYIILLNCFVFVLIGLQLKNITSLMTIAQMGLYTIDALLIVFAMVVVRMIWVYANLGASLIHPLKHSKSTGFNSQMLREAAIIGWSGMRGIVSLSIALALPLTLTNGALLEGRNEVIFITFVVILITLLVPGLTLPALIRWLKIQRLSNQGEEQKIRTQLRSLAEEYLHQLRLSKDITQHEFDFLKTYFITQHYVSELSKNTDNTLQNFELVRLKIIQLQRKKLLTLWERQEIEDKLLMSLENELDMEELHRSRAELI